MKHTWPGAAVLVVLVTGCLVLTAARPQQSEDYDAYDEDYYGDFTAEDADTAAGNTTQGPDLVKIGATALHGFLGILEAKIKFLRSLLKNKDLHEQLGNTVKAGVDVTRSLVKAKLGVVKTVADVAPDVIDGTRSGTRLLGSVVRAANDTLPLIADGIQEAQDMIPIVTGFATAYAEVNAEQAQKVASKFVGAFQCDQQCGNLTDEDLLAECSKQFCTQEEEDAYADYYDEEAEQTV